MPATEIKGDESWASFMATFVRFEVLERSTFLLPSSAPIFISTSSDANHGGRYDTRRRDVGYTGNIGSI